MSTYIMDKLVDKSFWQSMLGIIGGIATGATTILDPHVAGFVGTGFCFLTGPVGKGIAKVVSISTANYAQTETKVDDAIHAASSTLAGE